VQREDDRDRAIDRVLRQSMPSERRESSGAARTESTHLDGETLAAWAGGQLRPDAAAPIEQHLSDCTRCQQMLAAFARTAPPQIVVEPLWRRWHLQWLVPIATAATVAAIWVAIPRQEQTRTLAPPLTDRRDVPVAQPPAPAVAAPTFRAEASTPTQPPAASALAESAPQNQSPRPLAKSTALSPSAKREEFERRDAQDRFARRQTDATPPAPTAPVIGQAGARERESDAAQPQQQAITPAAPPAAVAPAAAPAAPATAPAPTAANPTSAAGASTSSAARRGLGNSPLLAARAFATPEIRSPNASMRWRILEGGRQIERTTNGGLQWDAAMLSSPAVITYGMSPAPSVCWIVGRGGAVYVTTDGLRFVRLMFPESIDLLSVTATDDRHATVMSADGRSFRTDDQGATWSGP
jgi:hypothetical protein